MKFEDILPALRRGGKAHRRAWGAREEWIEFQLQLMNRPDQAPHVHFRTARGALTPWSCSQADLTEDDWEIIA